jgi:hypothetical protein
MHACREKSWKDFYNNEKNQIMQELINKRTNKDKKKGSRRLSQDRL